jgi:hypothetical protein
LEFGSGELESAYQVYLANHAGGYLLAFLPMFVFTWAQFLYCIAISGHFTHLSFPPGFLITVVLFMVPTIGHVAFICMCREQYARHWRGINALDQTLKLFSTNAFQSLCIWQVSCTAQGVCKIFQKVGESPVNSFARENFYLTNICLANMVFAAGQIPDLIITTCCLFFNMAGSKALCESPHWGPERVTLSAPLSSIPRRGSLLFLVFFPPSSDTIKWLPPQELSCPAVLAFWQVVGWWLSCIFIILREILSRRAFLKSTGTTFGPLVASRVAGWPLGDALMVNRLIFMVFFLSFAVGVVWSSAVQVFSSSGWEAFL